ncbi:hypothetical protein F5B22DRAFT_248698 [Xylaria bambusicola]|uniref:uncharacterized protein n=1 Tax=Xylaria bambusicola TaxID=326684 RepID=UPI002008957E|nr:uncharacterized protein F5B22DRAFT_248698 [Xylaria bambusicola]KAI0513327.1 hypothetical protein F5B22DRAFT_248698 [Xylaria bambusicola]
MVRFSAPVATILALAMTVTAIPAPAPALPDPAGDANVGNQNGGQFIGGQCINSLDCASTCCATFGSIGLCSGLGAQFQAGKTGCGFGASATPATPDNNTGNDNSGSDNNDNSGNNNTGNNGNAGGSGTVTVDPNTAGSQNVGLGNGSQFITGQCLSDADCASGCCATDGKCAARAVVESAQDARECGFVGTLARL